MLAHPQGKGPQTTMKEKAGVGIERPTQFIEQLDDRLEHSFRSGDRTRDQIGVSVHVLRRAVQREIEALLDRSVENWRHEGRIDHREE